MHIGEWVLKYVSKPYEKMDCWQLVNRVYQDRYAVDLGDVNEQRAKIREEEWTDVLAEKSGIIEGDVLLFRSTPINRHVGIVLTNNYMLHSRKPVGVVIERWDRGQWKHQLKAAYRHKSR